MSVNLVESEFSDHSLEDVHCLLLEVVLVVVNPAEQCRDESIKMRGDKGSGQSNGEKLDQAEG